MNSHVQESPPRSFRSFGLSSILWLVLCVACFFAGLNWSDIVPSSLPGPQTVDKTNYVSLNSGGTQVLTSISGIHRVAVTDPKVADYVFASPNELMVNAKIPGKTSIVVWENGAKESKSIQVVIK
ncbi:MAG: pilus assembly protein N-terminal domain-containing protein [Planctomycetota bacterium]